MGGLVAALFAELAVITWRSLGRPTPGQTSTTSDSGQPPLPFPSQYAAAFGIYGALGLLAGVGEGAGSVANIFGWGLVLATALNIVDPAGSLENTAATKAGTQQPFPTSTPTAAQTATSPGVTTL